ATTDANGVATFTNLDPTTTINVQVPAQNLSGNPGMDFGSASDSITIQSSGNVLAINVTSEFLSNTPSLASSGPSSNLTIFPPNGDTFAFSTGIVTTNTATSSSFASDLVGGRGFSFPIDEAHTFNRFITTPDGSVQFVFETPALVVTSTAGLEPHFS